jgi:hypothetical protein
MQKKKLPRDANALAARIVAMSIGQEPPDLSAITGAQIGNPPIVSEEPKKNPAAVALGRLGGLKGGKARAEKLSARKRKQIATKAASARWKVKKDQKKEV